MQTTFIVMFDETLNCVFGLIIAVELVTFNHFTLLIVPKLNGLIAPANRLFLLFGPTIQGAKTI